MDHHSQSSDVPINHKNGVHNAVRLRVYDISQGAARCWSPFLLGRHVEGIWHSGIEVYGYEYFYGGGIVKMRPDVVESTFGIKPSRIHDLGVTSMDRSAFERWLVSIMPEFRKEVYDLVKWNCNHFTDHVARKLVGQSIPDYIRDLPQAVCTSLVGRLILLFIRMTQGGNAPIGIDDPQHPSQRLTRRRRYSCPASPVNLNKAVAGSVRRPLTSADFRAALAPVSMSSSPLSLRDSEPPLISAPTPPCLETCSLGDAVRSKRAQTAPLRIRTCRPEVESRLRNRAMPDDLQEIAGSDIGTHTTAVILSPKHRRLYEAERDKLLLTKHRKRTKSKRGTKVDRSTIPVSSLIVAPIPSPLELATRAAAKNSARTVPLLRSAGPS
eukprot:Protomagalhaensia_sp_Gyna_25__1411@NODE_1711_length_1594_cov_272_495820_g1161_i1_p1_GENE_NODE_1711_length_1594_cov_272_495820_g1161_i1NODE_1711_length_1594_cov_272_495820_g1161_i1_p1_ORF_typecomplete_len382_score36_94Peptidase_C97/PF05903_14/2_7e34_NODE_1711_length_1594_cov_272_495820_g1161_i1591204